MPTQLFVVVTGDAESAPMPMNEARGALAELKAEGLAPVLVSYPDGEPL